MEKGGKNENGRVAPHESMPILLNFGAVSSRCGLLSKAFVSKYFTWKNTIIQF